MLTGSGWNNAVAAGCQVLMMGVLSSLLVWGSGCTSRASALMAPDLDEAIRGAAEGELIPVILTLPPFPGEDSGPSDGGIQARKQWADKTQRAVLDLLEARQREGHAARIRSLWITNSIAAHATVRVIRELQSRDDILTIARDRPLLLPEQRPEQGTP
ncbi:MAG: hypothetical protein AB1451_15880 [Nitrospirota bacterium]